VGGGGEVQGITGPAGMEENTAIEREGGRKGEREGGASDR